MTKRAFDKIKTGLDSTKAYLDGTADKRKYRVHVPETIDVRKIPDLACRKRPLLKLAASPLQPCAIGSKAATALSAVHVSC